MCKRGPKRAGTAVMLDAVAGATRAFALTHNESRKSRCLASIVMPNRVGQWGEVWLPEPEGNLCNSQVSPKKEPPGAPGTLRLPF